MSSKHGTQSVEYPVAQKDKANRIIFNYHTDKPWPALPLIIFQLILPIFIISTFQTLALIPPMIMAFRSGAILDLINSMGILSTDSGSMGATINVSNVYDVTMKFFLEMMQTKEFLFFMALGYMATIAVYVVIVKFAEKRSLETIGLPIKGSGVIKRAGMSYLRGLGIGLSMMLLVFLLLLLTGQVKITGFGLQSGGLVIFLASIFMWIPQGAAEEISTRGYMMPRISSRFGRVIAVAVSSLYFSVLHMGNNGFSLVAFINLILIAFFFAVFALITQEIWTVCACHSVWNFAQGNLFGLSVSGGASSATLIQTKVTENPLNILTGGDFGPEGGLIVTAVIILAMGVLFFVTKKKNLLKLKTK